MPPAANLSSLPHLQVWAHYEEQPVEEALPVLEEKERSASYKPVFVTEITDDLHFYVQDVETGECPCVAAAAAQIPAWPSPPQGVGPRAPDSPKELTTATAPMSISLGLRVTSETHSEPWSGGMLQAKQVL